MKKIMKVKYGSYARNSEHFQLYSSLLSDITEELASKYKLTTYRTAFLNSLEKEKDAFLQNQAYKETVLINTKNEVCDRLFRSFNLLVQSKKLGYIDEEREAAELILYALKPYANAPYKPHAENIAMIKDLVNELESDKFTSAIHLLGLSAYVVELKNAMLAFESAYRERSEIKLERSMIDTMKNIRPIVEKNFDVLSEVISACYMMAAYIEKEAEKAKELEEVVDRMNSAINEYHDIILRRVRNARLKTNSDSEASSDE